jgi:hypothetical protein
VELVAVGAAQSVGMELTQLQEQPILAVAAVLDLSIRAKTDRLAVQVLSFFVIQTAAQSLLVQVLLVLKVLQAVDSSAQQLLLAQEM